MAKPLTWPQLWFVWEPSGYVQMEAGKDGRYHRSNACTDPGRMWTGGWLSKRIGNGTVTRLPFPGCQDWDFSYYLRSNGCGVCKIKSRSPFHRFFAALGTA